MERLQKYKNKKTGEIVYFQFSKDEFGTYAQLIWPNGKKGHLYDYLHWAMSGIWEPLQTPQKPKL